MSSRRLFVFTTSVVLTAGVGVMGCTTDAHPETSRSRSSSTIPLSVPSSTVDATTPVGNSRFTSHASAVPGAAALAIGGGFVWVTTAQHELLKMAPDGQVLGYVPIAKGSPTPGEGYFGVAVGEGSVWAANPAENVVYRVDPETLTVSARIPVGPYPWGVAVGAGHVWVAIHHGTDHGALERIEPATNRVDGHVPLGPPNQGPGKVTMSGDAVWVAVDGDNVLARVDPATLEVTKRISVRGVCGGIAAVGKAIWVAGRICGSGVTRVDTVKGAAGHTVGLRGMTLGVAADEDSVWVASVLGRDSSVLTRLDATSEKVVDQLVFDHQLAGVALGFGSVWVAGGDQVVRVTHR